MDNLSENDSIMEELESDDESNKTEDLRRWIRALQEWVRTMEDIAAHKTSEVLGRAQMHCERDERTYRRINALVLKKYSLSKNSLSVRGTWMISLVIVVWEWLS
jgi:hypothetical protein